MAIMMENLVQTTQEKLIKVYERVRRITERAVTEKLMKMRQCFTEEEVQQILREADARVIDDILDELAHGCRVRPFPSPREGCSLCPGKKSDGVPVPALKKTDGGSPGEHDEAPRARGLKMDVASFYVQDHDEDAHFFHAEAGVIGVADGVGAFRKKGVDAGAFARALMENASAAAVTNGTAPVCPYTLLLDAYGKAARARTPGASTAVIVSLNGTTLLWTILGDSAFAVIHGGKVVHRSTPQQHHFNCPFQLRSKGGDRVSDAEVGGTPVEVGDIVVVGTDGLFDNVFDDELERVVGKGAEMGLSPQSMADSIAGAACEMARRRLAHSPFSVESWRRGNKRFYGGKVDDITVVVAFIIPV